ncbi:MAG: hypothetical protein K6F14_08055 [Clostridiales bacterium]|nr:hypothetical protein [Clostridiales bacterium]
MYNIAKPHPFDEKPSINAPEILGFSTGKPVLYRIPVTGERPIRISCINLPSTLALDGQIIKGTINVHCETDITIEAENTKGKDIKTIKLIIDDDTILLTPLLGFTTWNAFGNRVTQKNVEQTGELLIKTGLADYGYSYVNLDSGWQRSPLSENGTILPNDKFPSLESMTSKLHSLGLKAGIYSTPMLNAWGCPEEYDSVPGCTSGERDIRFARTNGGIGLVHNEQVNVRAWSEWGFDYLKYDWTPTDSVNADLMKKELLKSDRCFGYCVSVAAVPQYMDYWMANVNSYRCNSDSKDEWGNVKRLFDSANGWEKAVKRGHFFDLDMLELGYMGLFGRYCTLSEEEQIFAYTMRVIYSSPIQISCDLSQMTDFEFSVYANEEVLRVNQDPLTLPCEKVMQGNCAVISKELVDGKALAVFNPTENEETVCCTLEKEMTVRDIWAKEDLENTGEIHLKLKPHEARLFRLY